jgi:hypothetical protein
MLQPYSIIAKDGAAFFTADNKAIYKAFFQAVPFSGEPQLEGFFVDFTFKRDTSQCADAKAKDSTGAFKKIVGREDGRIKATLQLILNTFFENNPYYTVFFTCDSTDSKQRGRLLMFNEWHAEHQDKFTKLPFCISGAMIDEDILPDTVGGIIFLTEHPQQELIKNFVTSEIVVYNSIKITT